ncbi:MAG: DoxX family protein [Deltaproteobacteria bacterium]|nr:DoxX family protein [Deltaproteobacteria bacterium]
MQSLAILCQLVIALGIFNVWIIRYGKETNWRGGEAKNMKEEFAAYGLPGGFMIFIGAAKILLATCLIIGIWIPLLVKPAAIAMAFLMIGAVSMHVKVKDPLQKSLPAITMLVISLVVAIS